MKISYTPFEYNKFIKDNLNQNYLKQTGLSFSGDNFYSSNITSKNSAKVSFSASDKKNSEVKPENVDNLFKRIFKGIKTFVTDKKDIFATSENNPFATSENNPFDLRSKTYNLKKAKRGIKKRVLSDEFYSKDNFLAIKLNDILAKVQTQGHIQILNKLLDNKDLASQKNLSPYFERIIIQSDTKEKEDILLEVLDKIEANKHLINNEKFIVYVGLILLSTKSPESLKVLDSVFNNDDLLNNEHLMLNLSNILLYTNDEKNLQVVNSVFQKEELVKNKNVMGHLGDVLRFTKKEEHIELLNMVFEEEKFLNDRFMGSLTVIIKNTSDGRDFNIKKNIINKVLSSEQFLKSENLKDKLGEILLGLENEEKTQMVLSVLDKVASDKELLNNDNLVGQLGTVLAEMESVSEGKEKLNFLNKVSSNERILNNKIFMDCLGSYANKIKSKTHNEIMDIIIEKNEFFYNVDLLDSLSSILGSKDSQEEAQAKKLILDKISSDKNLLDNKNLMKNLGGIISVLHYPEQIDMVNSLLNQEDSLNNEKLMNDFKSILSSTSCNALKFLADKDFCAIYDGVELQLKKVLDSPEKYVNGESEFGDMMFDVLRYFNDNRSHLLVFSALFDKEGFNNLLRKRFDVVDEYIETLEDFEPSDMKLLYQMEKVVNQDEKPFMPNQKIEFINLLKAYKVNKLDIKLIEDMTKSGKIDLGKLQINLFKQIMKNSGFTDEEILSIPKEKLIAWDIKYVHFLSEEIEASDEDVFKDILRAGNLEEDFIGYIHDTNNVYGKANANTKTYFNENVLNYDKWINPTKDNEVKFVVVDKNKEKLSQISNQIVEDVEKLRSSAVKGFIDKQFVNCIKDDKFIIPAEIVANKFKMKEFTQNIIKQLDSVWKRAESNLSSSDVNRIQTAKGTLTILDHLKQRIEDIDKLKENNLTKDINWTIKMWDRVPQKDLFQGNYSTCCIGMGAGNGSAMPHYIMNTAYNMIEFIDNVSGKTVGNALCYFIKEQKGNPAFIIDNIEVANSSKLSDEAGVKLRGQIVEYASKVTEEVVGKKDVPIFMGDSYNDVPIDDLKRKTEKVSFIGDVDCSSIYMDLYDGWFEPKHLMQIVTLLKLK